MGNFLQLSMMKSGTPICLCFMLLGHLLLDAQEIKHVNDLRFLQHNVATGLPSNFVKCLWEDHDGYLWVGCRGGLLKYDGHRFDAWNHEDIKEIHQGQGASIWCATRSSLTWIADPRDKGSARSFPLADSMGTVESILSVAPDLVALGTSSGVFLMDTLGQIVQTAANGLAVHDMILDDQGRLWVGADAGFFVIDTAGGLHFERFDRLDSHVGSDAYDGHHIQRDRAGRIWLFTLPKIYHPTEHDQKVFCLDPRSGTIRHLILPESTFLLIHIQPLADGMLWLSVDVNGILKVEAEDVTWTDSTIVLDAWRRYDWQSEADKSAMKSNSLESIVDRSGSIWFGTDWFGLFQIPRRLNTFKYVPLPEPKPKDFKSTSDLVEDPEGHIWISTYLGGVYRWDRARDDFRHYRHEPGNPYSLKTDNVFFLSLDHNGVIWASSEGRSINHFDKALDQFVPLQIGDDANFSDRMLRIRSHTAVHGGAVDKHGYLWSGSNGLGISMIDTRTKEERLNLANFAKLQWETLPGEFYDNMFMSPFVDSEDNIWAFSNFSGLYKLSRTNDPLQFDIRKTKTFPGIILEIQEDREGYFWLSTIDKGLFKYDKDQDTILRQFSIDHGFPHNTIMDIVADPSGHYWIICPNALLRFDPLTENYVSYGSEYGFDFFPELKNEGIVTSKQELMIAGRHGLYMLDLENKNSLDLATDRPATAIRRIRVNDQSVRWLGENTIYTLAHHENDLEISYDGLYLDCPELVEYSYRMEGLQDDWLHVGQQRIARFLSLAPAQYRFHLRTRLKDGAWSPASSVSFVVKKAWWSTNAARAGYATLLLLLLYGYHLLKTRQNRALSDQRRLRELGALKTKMYTNLTHEFRTPLTVIQGMTEELKSNPTANRDRGLSMIKRNASHLLALVNQMLEMQKLESGVTQISNAAGDLIVYVQYMVEGFESLAAKKRIDLQFHADRTHLPVIYDEDKLQHILSNLISNAIKYTNEQGQVVVSLRADEQPENKIQVLLKVEDNGIGIPQDEQAHIFDRFYQVDTRRMHPSGSTGIGLALTKELVNLLGGEIQVQSSPGTGTTFTVSLRLARSTPKAMDPNKPSLSPASALAPTLTNQILDADIDADRILIVEDNEDVAEYITHCLQEDYAVFRASDGSEGFEKAIELMPDVIISDIMMPAKDGFELSRDLKRDVRTSHIPIILLSALSDMQSKIQGYEEMVDEYLVKPFNRTELLSRIRNLINIRQLLQEKYRKTGLLAPEKHLSENKFLSKLQACLSQHLDEEHYGIAELCQDMAMSRTQLHRKLKALTGESTTEFIRKFKLKKAKQLLETGNLNVNEVSYAVGYKSRSLFSRHFSQRYGCAPSEIRRK